MLFEEVTIQGWTSREERGLTIAPPSFGSIKGIRIQEIPRPRSERPTRSSLLPVLSTLVRIP